MTLGVFSLYNVRRQEHKANGIMAGLRQFDIELGTFFDQKGVRQLKEDTRAVAGIHIGALSAAVVVAWFGRGWVSELTAVLPGGGDAVAWSGVAALCLLGNWGVGLLRGQHMRGSHAGA